MVDDLAQHGNFPLSLKMGQLYTIQTGQQTEAGALYVNAAHAWLELSPSNRLQASQPRLQAAGQLSLNSALLQAS